MKIYRKIIGEIVDGGKSSWMGVLDVIDQKKRLSDWIKPEEKNKVFHPQV